MLHAATLKNLCFGAAKPSGLHRQWWPREPLELLLLQSSKCTLPKAAVRTELVLPAWEVSGVFAEGKLFAFQHEVTSGLEFSDIFYFYFFI